ncbi:armadillo-type protein [Mycena leptocephala]|nr:armadillo-type protein [Mycena leptocephala]
MPPLTRQDSRTSIFSWWSDSNPLLKGPTINLHAAAKPLMKFMHHRQALDLIRKNQGSPLSTTKLEIYSSYFPWDYVSGATKAAILEELANRIDVSEGEARAVVDSPVFRHIWEMLASPDPVARGLACRLLGLLTQYEFARPSIMETRGCEQLVALLLDQDNRAVLWAMHAAAQIAHWSEGMQAMVDNKALEFIEKNRGSLVLTETLEMYSSYFLWDYVSWATKAAILEELANKIFASEDEAQAVLTGFSVLALRTTGMVLKFIRENKGSPLSTKKLEIYSSYFLWDYVSWATKAAILQELANKIFVSEGEARAVVDSPVFHRICEILASPDPMAQSSACWLLGLLASYEFAIPSILETKGCEQLVAFLHDPDNRAGLLTMHKAAQFARWSLGMQGLVNAKALDLIRENQASPLSGIKLEIYSSHFPWDYVSCATKIAILQALAIRSFISEGEAQAVVHSPVFRHIWQMLASPDPFAISLILEMGGCEQLVALLNDRDNMVVFRAAHALAVIAQSLEGAQAMVDANVLDHILKLLKSQSSEVAGWTCRLVAELFGHNLTLPAILRLNLLNVSKQLMLLSRRLSWYADRALQALHGISEWPEGVAALADTDIFEELQQLVAPEDSGFNRSEIRAILANVARYKAGKTDSTLEFIGKNEGSPLSTTLEIYTSYFPRDYVSWGTKTAILRELERKLESEVDARAVVDSPVLNYIGEILESPDPVARRSSCWLLTGLAWYKFAIPPILEMGTCERLVALLDDPDNRAVVPTICVAHWLEGALAMVDAKVQHHISKLLKSQSSEVTEGTCWLVAKLAGHDLTASAILKLNLLALSKQLVILSRRPTWSVLSRNAIRALRAISEWPEGVVTLANTEAFEELRWWQLITYKNPDQDLCAVIDNVARYKAGWYYHGPNDSAP